MKRRSFFAAIAGLLCLPWWKKSVDAGDFVIPREFTVDELARYYNVPRSLISDGKDHFDIMEERLDLWRRGLMTTNGIRAVKREDVIDG